MNTYIYQADIYCEACGESIIARLRAADKEDTGDSEDFPQGPYSNGGGESDTPQHCGSGEDCLNALEVKGSDGNLYKVGCFFKNPLTADGFDYVLEAYQRKLDTGKGLVADLWADYYDIGNQDGKAIFLHDPKNT